MRSISVLSSKFELKWYSSLKMLRYWVKMANKCSRINSKYCFRYFPLSPRPSMSDINESKNNHFEHMSTPETAFQEYPITDHDLQANSSPFLVLRVATLRIC